MKTGVLDGCVSVGGAGDEGERGVRETQAEHEGHDPALVDGRLHGRHHGGREKGEGDVGQDVDELQPDLGGILVDAGVIGRRAQHPARGAALEGADEEGGHGPGEGDGEDGVEGEGDPALGLDGDDEQGDGGLGGGGGGVEEEVGGVVGLTWC